MARRWWTYAGDGRTNILARPHRSEAEAQYDYEMLKTYGNVRTIGRSARPITAKRLKTRLAQRFGEATTVEVAA